MKRTNNALAKALFQCRIRGVAEPPWLYKAIHDAKADELLKQHGYIGRKTNVLVDGFLYQTVTEYCATMTKEKAFEKVATDFAYMVTENKNSDGRPLRRDDIPLDAVKVAYRRHKKIKDAFKKLIEEGMSKKEAGKRIILDFCLNDKLVLKDE